MLLKLLKFLFKKLIADLPPETKHKLWLDFQDLLREVVKAAATGAVSGAMKK